MKPVAIPVKQSVTFLAFLLSILNFALNANALVQSIEQSKKALEHEIFSSDPLPIQLYLGLMKKTLINLIYCDPPLRRFSGDRNKLIYDQKVRENGKDWPSLAHTMIGMKRLNNIQFCVEDVIKKNIPGDLIETGVWRGGATIFMRAILKAFNQTNRRVWVADSFEGLPKPNVKKYPEDKGINLYVFKELAVSLEEVKSNFNKYDLLDEQVIFLKGWFSQTLPNAPIQRLAVMRLDGDLYESTMDALMSLYPKLSIGGYVILDDYYNIPAVTRATQDYRKKYNITDPIQRIDDFGAFWQRMKKHK